MNKTAILMKKYHKETGKEEWVLVSRHDKSKNLKWFGTKKPSHKRVVKEERRIQFFKHHGSLVENMMIVADLLDEKGYCDLADKLSHCVVEKINGNEKTSIEKIANQLKKSGEEDLANNIKKFI